MTIKLLSESTINRIAAGEVIERPASVVKELVENAVDAGSTKIDIILERAGKNLIIISDDGVGMTDKELEIAVERHTTSKLDETDFLNIHTFGFRGEALPSIAAISKMLITSKKRDNQKAFQIKLIGGDEKQIAPAIHNEGTKIEIRDLFFATPARLKFLRTDKTELAATVDVVKKIALAHPEISFSLTHDGKTLLKLKGQNKDAENNLKQRIIDVIGEDFIKNASYIDFKSPDFSIYGYTSIPTYNRASSEDQFLFINNRPVKDKLLQVALRVAYQDYMPRDRYPLCAIFLQIDPQLVDVNVHPAKAEVRFHDPNYVRNLLIDSIKNALSNKSHIASTTIASSAIELFKNPFVNKEPAISKPLNVNSKPSEYRPATSPTVPKYTPNNSCQKLIDTLPHARIEQEVEQRIQNEPQKSSQYRLGAAKAQLHTTYVISQTEDSIVITDQHAAHERLGYEKIKNYIKNEELIKQRLLIPEIVELPDEKRADILYENKDKLSKLGLSLEKFGEKSIIVTEIPNILGDINVQKLIQDLADHLAECGENIALTELIEHVTETYACHYSIRAGRKLSADEMNALLRQMENTPFSGQCNHGRPTYIELKLKDIERLFGRK
ncbi:DNA mismatch repair protein MutL [Rickettsia bellii]|uniref:DNA mismatch repair protein MutL n=2 Tax=Rickettsia bellii TaxID=33990 RepID=MUTL_RICBR|nr:DNA mismatch repair endonuclease MutL [Rickettsia bellii]Q1RGP6.1 RecName: Full=DNA mismatch repair protein MutL [Rickettsia bellii RML369-C]ABE05468.1 DNA mismatch repair protein MutL [Rickettsia bellii RML369-C]ARD85988.1 DNA mismatch repair protein MutL [Rickettsia bellii]KJV90558.1 DNA mismatch repair MutL family protein [Rickettsia bellii str. RML An4]